MIFLQTVFGLAILIAGGDFFVRGTVGAAERIGISPLIIGLTFVAFATSLPELATSIQAAQVQAAGIVFGNIVGSNICNLLLVLGISAMLAPISCTHRCLMRDGTLVFGTAVILVLVAFSGGLTRTIGLALMAGLAAYLVLALRTGQTEPAASCSTDSSEQPKPAGPFMSSWRIGIFIVIGLALIAVGSKFFVQGAISIAADLGVAQSVIGITIVALGTSLPELVTSVIAALRGHSDLALGNVLGSNIYNVLGIGGMTGIIAPIDIPIEIATFDIPVMIVTTAVALWFAVTGLRISRGEGGLLLSGYGAYMLFVWP